MEVKTVVSDNPWYRGSYHVIPAALDFHKVGQRNAVEEIVYRSVKIFPHRQRAALGRARARPRSVRKTRHRRQRALSSAQYVADAVLLGRADKAVAAALDRKSVV